MASHTTPPENTLLMSLEGDQSKCPCCNCLWDSSHSGTIISLRETTRGGTHLWTPGSGDANPAQHSRCHKAICPGSVTCKTHEFLLNNIITCSQATHEGRGNKRHAQEKKKKKRLLRNLVSLLMDSPAELKFLENIRIYKCFLVR